LPRHGWHANFGGEFVGMAEKTFTTETQRHGEKKTRCLLYSIPELFCGAQGFLVWNFESGI
jgi:hypothetical protein